MNTYSVEVVHKICLWAYGETSKHTKNEIYTTKNKNVFQRWKQRERMPRATRCVPQKRAVKFSGAMYLSVWVCANCLHVCVILSVCAPCTLYCMLCVWLGKYFGRILISSKLLYILLDRTHFATIKYYMKNRKRMTLKMGRRSTHTHTLSYSHTHTRTRARQIDRAKLINCKLPVRVL